ncbi:hypothetical protein, partial [Methanoculleus sp.]|uniref:hypothetical protein n=1 Tax=Methanoculleus sp. TaxID=90427 RepID=UPI0025F71C31
RVRGHQRLLIGWSSWNPLAGSVEGWSVYGRLLIILDVMPLWPLRKFGCGAGSLNQGFARSRGGASRVHSV